MTLSALVEEFNNAEIKSMAEALLANGFVSTTELIEKIDSAIVKCNERLDIGEIALFLKDLKMMLVS
jgi:hypothetical protein